MKSISTLRTIFLITVITFPFLTSGQNSTTAGVTTLTGTSQRTGEPDLISGSALAGQNLTPYQPSGWDNKIVISATTGTSTSTSPIFSNQTLYVDWAVTNNGTDAISTTFYSRIYVDGVQKGNWNTSGLAAGYWAYVGDHNIGMLSVGDHQIRIDVDATGVVTETSEADNSYTRTIRVYPNVNLTAYQLIGWDNKIVLSTVTGTNTSDTQIFDTDKIYLDWGIANVSAFSTTTAFYIDLYIDGIWKTAWSRAGLGAGATTSQLDYLVGKLTTGSHTFKIVIDQDRYVPESNESDNEYSRTITVVNKNVLPYKPGNWDNKLVLSTVTGTNTSASAFYNNQDIFVDWDVWNNGSANITETFHSKLMVDGVQKGYWFTAGLAANYTAYVADVNIGKLATGNHTIQIVMDCDGEVTETNEADNSYSRTINVGPSYNLTSFQPGGWDDKLVLSTVTGTNTSASVFYDTQTIYVDWGCINNAYDNIAGTFYIRLYVDGVSKGAWTKTGLAHNTYTWGVDGSVGKLSAGIHTFKLVVDADANVAESDETDNEYTRTITVVNKNLQTYQPAGWDNSIVLSTVPLTNTSTTTICDDETVYMDYSILNKGSAAITETFYVRLFVDGVAKATWTRTGLNTNTYYTIQDFAIGTLPAGSHTIKIVADVTDVVDETSETDNEYSRTINVSTGKNLTPYQPSTWDNKLVLSTGTGTYTSTSSIYDNQPVYLDWAIISNGVNNITETFTVKLYVDGVLKNTWTRIGMNAGMYLYNPDYIVGTLTSGNHTFKIVADADNTVVESDEADNEYSRSITVLSSVIAAPVAAAATGITQTGFNANWNAVTGATGYYLDVSASNTFSSFVTGYSNKNVGNVLTSAVSGLTPGTTYYYRIRSYGPVSTSPNSNTITVITNLSTPVAKVARNITQVSFDANWDALSGATGYYLDVSTSNTFGSFVSGYQNKDVGNVLTFTINGLASGTNYYYRVRAYNTSFTSSNSNLVNVVTKLAPVIAKEATDITRSGFSANWNACTGTTGYRLDVSTSGSFISFVNGYKNKDVGNVLTAPVTGLTPCITYYYRIRPYNSIDSGDDSNLITVVLINNAPTVMNKIPNYQINTGQTLNIPISPINGLIFFDVDPVDVLSVSATELSGAPLPPFITHFENILIVRPALADTGCIHIVVKASDLCNASVTDTLRLCIHLNTGISEQYLQSVFILYPNPTTGQVRINSDIDYKCMSVSVYNVLGSKIFSKEYFVNEQVLFDLSGHSPGMYLVRLKTGNIEISKNVILNKLK